MTARRLVRPTNVIWVVAAALLFAVAALFFVGNIRGPYEWDGRTLEPEPLWGTVQFLPGLLAASLAMIGVTRAHRRPWLIGWSAGLALWLFAFFVGGVALT